MRVVHTPELTEQVALYIALFAMYGLERTARLPLTLSTIPRALCVQQKTTSRQFSKPVPILFSYDLKKAAANARNTVTLSRRRNVFLDPYVVTVPGNAALQQGCARPV